jgi:serine/threonine protein kinase
MEALQTGTQIGAYVIDRNVATGGMGNVYLGCDQDGQRVILKFPFISMLGDPAVFERYQRELKIGYLLHHPRVQHLLDTGEYNGYPFMVLEYVEGETLREYLRVRAPLSIPEALPILDELCQAVAYCHELGVIHRDLKPENIIINPAGKPSIIDFGIALLRGARRITWSGFSATVGTPDYMAPEQIQGKRGDGRIDIYALAAMGYEFLSGQPPFGGDNPLEVMGQHLYADLPSLATVAPTVPATLSAVITKGLQRNPDDRYQSVEEFRQALLHYSTEPSPTLAMPPKPSVPSRWRHTLVSSAIIIGIMLAIIMLGVLAQFAHGGK